MQTDTALERPDPDGRIELTSNGWVLAFDRQFDYPRSHIWHILTDPDKVGRWLGRLDPGYEQGEGYRVDLGGGAFAEGTVLFLNRPTGLQVTWEDELGNESVVEWRVLESNGGTLLQFRTASDSPTFLAEGAAGWEGLLERFTAVADGREPGSPSVPWVHLRDAYAQAFGISPTMGLPITVSGHPAARFQRRLEADASRVWQALTQPSLLSRWLGRTEIQLQAGGSVHLDFDEKAVTGDVIYAESERALDFTWSGPGATDSVVHWALEPAKDADDDATLLTVTHVLAGDGDLATLLAGWHQHLDGLEQLLDSEDWQRSAGRHAALKAFYGRQLS